jgi:Na+-driven multidrug efflux pump
MPAAHSPIRREIIATVALAAPLAGANLAQMAMGVTNALMVGHLGGAALAAAGLGAGLNFSLVMVCQGVLTAVSPLAAHGSALATAPLPAASLAPGWCSPRRWPCRCWRS